MSGTQERPEIPMQLGLRVDVLDNEGIWNTGSIADVSRDGDDMVEIKYDGWGEEYNEWVALSTNRLAPLHMYTMVKKCWAKLHKWPWWPAFVVLRAPSHKGAAAALEDETKLYVEFFDSYKEEKRSRCWMQKKNVSSFMEGFDARASKNVGKNFAVFVEGTQRAMAGGSPLLFTGSGTLPIEFSSKYAEPLARRRAQLVDSDEKWYEAYRIFSGRYKLLYGYEFARDSVTQVLAVQHAKGKGKGKGKTNGKQGGNDDDDEVEIVTADDVLPRKPTPSVKGRGRGRPPKAKPTEKTAKVASRDDKAGSAENDDESEEQDDPMDGDASENEEEDDAEDDEEDEEEEDPISLRGRRSSRLTKKRKPEPEETAGSRRSTRPRRTKVLEQLVASSRASPSSRPSSVSASTPLSSPSRSVASPARRASESSTRRRLSTLDTSDSEPNAASDKAKVDQVIENFHKDERTETITPESSQGPSDHTDSIRHEEEAPNHNDAQNVSNESVTVERREIGESSDRSAQQPRSATSASRRKSQNPQARNGSLLVPLDRENADDGGNHINTSGLSPGRLQGLEGGETRYAPWLGLGVADDSAHRGWSIQNWLVSGLRKAFSSSTRKANE